MVRITPSENCWSKVNTVFLETSQKHSFSVLTNAHMLHKLLCVGADTREPSVSAQSHLTDRAAEAHSTPLPLPPCEAATSRVGCLPHPDSVHGMGAPRGQERSGEPPGGAGMRWVVSPSSGLLSQFPITTMISQRCNYPLLPSCPTRPGV